MHPFSGLVQIEKGNDFISKLSLFNMLIASSMCIAHVGD